MIRREFGPAQWFTWFAAALWTLFGTCLAALLLGQDGAINPVVGVPPPAALATYAAASLHRQDRRTRRKGGETA